MDSFHSHLDFRLCSPWCSVDTQMVTLGLQGTTGGSSAFSVVLPASPLPTVQRHSCSKLPLTSKLSPKAFPRQNNHSNRSHLLYLSRRFIFTAHGYLRFSSFLKAACFCFRHLGHTSEQRCCKISMCFQHF